MNTLWRRTAFQFSLPLKLSCSWVPRTGICRLVCTQVSTPKKSVLLARRQLDTQGREYIRLDGFLKIQGLASTGGQAKVLIQEGEVRVNGNVETRRGKKLLEGDIVSLENESLAVEFTDDPSEC